MPEAIWVIEVKDFPAVVTMDSHGQSLHEAVEKESARVLAACWQSDLLTRQKERSVDRSFY